MITWDGGEPPSSVRFRTNPALRLVPDPMVVEDDLDDRFGVAALGACHAAIDCNTALLLHTLSEPSPIPAFAASGLLKHRAAALRQLVLSHLVEVERPDGSFASGQPGAALIGGAAASEVDELAMRAVVFAAAIRHLPPEALTAALYTYNTAPVQRVWRSTMGEDIQVRAFLRLDELRASVQQTDGWWYVHPQNAGRPADVANKLYISPITDSLPLVIDRAAPLLAARAQQWKVGRGLAGIVRPDKCVAYFGSPDALIDTADELAAMLDGVPAQGVPFTAALTPNRLLSWAIDPPETSWRHWVSETLAHSLAAAATGDGSPDDAALHALNVLETRGVDLSTFSPSDTWKELR